MKEIDLYSEAKPRYHQLISNKEDGLIILAQYHKYQKQEFTEDQIIQIQEINKHLDKIKEIEIKLDKAIYRTNRNDTIITKVINFQRDNLKWKFKMPGIMRLNSLIITG